MGALLLALVAAMTLFVVEHNIAQAQASDVATLSSLTVTAGGNDFALMPAFVPDAAPAAGGYVVYVAATGVDDVTVAATATHSGATEVITAKNQDGAETEVNVLPGEVTLDEAGKTTKIDVKVTAQDEFATETYTINVMRASASTSRTATLSSLSLTAGGDNLITAFVPNDGANTVTAGVHDTPHSVRVSAATSSVVVNATTSHTGATVKTSSGTQTGDGVNDRFTLKAADMVTEIKVEVTAQDKATTLAYMITVTRASITASKDTTLRQLQLTKPDSDDDGARDPVELTPSFVANRGPTSGGYSASIGSGDANVVLTASSSHAGATVTVTDEDDEPVDEDADGTAAAGEYASDAVTIDADGKTFKVKVTAEDGVASATYEITVSMDVADAGVGVATLKKLSVMAGSTELINDFASGDISYMGDVAARTSSVRVDAVASNSRADVVVMSDGGAVTGNGPYTARLNDAGQNTVITVTVESADESLTRDYIITIARAGSSDSTQATLNSLIVQSGTSADEEDAALALMPGFTADSDPASGGYVVYVADSVAMLTVRAVATHRAASVAITADTDTDSDDTTASPRNISLVDDDTKIDVKVTAQDEFTSETYTINVMKVEDASMTATLSSLSLTAGGDNLITAFVPNDGANTVTAGVHDTPHSVRVSAATSSVVVNATTSHTGATVKTSSGTRTGDGVNDRFTLKAAGMDTDIMVEVTAQDKATTLAYMITVTRASITASKDTTLRTLMLTMDDADVELTPSFVANRGPASGGYSARVSSANATVTVTLNASSSHAGAMVAVTDEDDGTVEDTEIEVDGEFVGAVAIGADGKTFKVKVTAEDGVANATYEITVSKETAVTNSDLSSLTLDGIDLIPAFESGTIAYIANATTDIATAEVMATTAHAKADVVIRKVVDADDTVDNTEFNDMEHGKGFGSVSAMVPLSIGINTITIQVNAVAIPTDMNEPNETVYRVRVRRSGSESDNATLSALSLGDDVGMSPTFAGTRTQYTAEAPTGTTQVTVMATASHDNAEVDIMPADNDTEMEGHQVAISGDGTANIIVEVTAEDGTTTETYTVTVTVLAANALLTKYDTNINGRIDKPEVLVAIQNYIVLRTIDKLEVLRVISLYLIGPQ